MIFNNPFYILGATSRHTRQKIVELAEEKSFEINEDLCQKARSDLTMPKNRLIAELNWFIGISPRKIEILLSNIRNISKEVIYTEGLPELAKINLLSEILENEKFSLSDDELEDVICKIIDAYENLSIDAILRDINEERQIARFPEVLDVESIENELDTKKRACTKLIIKRLNNLNTMDMIKTVTDIVDNATSNGEVQAASMIDDLIDDYKLHTRDFLENEFKTIKKIIDIIQKRASEGESSIALLVDKLLQVTKIWDDVAQPIQLSLKSRGLNDNLSIQIAATIRSLGIELVNNYGYLDISQKISKSLAELFAELPEMAERLEEDIDTLEDMIYQR